MQVDTNALPRDYARKARQYEELFKLPAWQEIVRDAAEQAENLKTFLVTNAESERDLHRARGAIGVLLYIANLEALKEREFAEAANEAALTADEEAASFGANA